jgi:FKBP-type peptidyl-prolyl cis-trans isomerase
LVKYCSVTNKTVFLCMLLRNAFLIIVGLFLLVLYSCDQPALYDEAAREAQLPKDVETIANYVTSKGLAFAKDPSGISYRIERKGTGSVVLGEDDTVMVTFEGRLIPSDSLVEVAVDSAKLVVSSMIAGWKTGLRIVPLGSTNSVQPGGNIQLLIPSTLAYINREVYTTINPALGIYVGKIPANSCLSYNIQILKIYKKKIP